VRKHFPPIPKLILLFLISAVLFGCSSDDMGDLREFVKNTHADRKPRIEPLPEVKTHEPFAFVAEDTIDPFGRFNLKPRNRAATTGRGPDQNRRKEPLEDYPLDGLKMKGTLSRGKDSWAIIQAPDGTVHRAKIGDHMGQNEGMVTEITDEKVGLIELIRNPLGEWIEREANIAILE